MSDFSYRPEIDGLRAIAVLAVIFYHADIPWASAGYVGVDIFFVISGYLITGIIVRQLKRGDFTIRSFYERRIRRILPALVLIVSCCIPVAWFILAPSALRDFLQSVGAVSLFSSNMLFWLESGYFDLDAGRKPLLHTWSLAVEEQFYLFYPLLLGLLWKRARERIGIILAGLLVFSVIVALWLERIDPSAGFFLAPSRAWQLLAGALVIFSSLTVKTSVVREMLSAAGLLIVLYSCTLASHTGEFPNTANVTATLGTVMLVAFCDTRTLVGRGLALRPLVGIGLVSYSAYLWHQPIFAFLKTAGLFPAAPLLLTALIIAVVALSWISWRFVEQPVRRQQSLSTRGLFLAAAAASAFLLLIGVAGYLLDGKSLRFSPAAQAIMATATHSPRRGECEFDDNQPFNAEDACAFFGANVQWAILGDSHGIELGYALAEKVRAADQAVLLLSYPGCGPALSLKEDDRFAACADWTHSALDYLDDQPSLENVIITYEFDTHFRESLGAEVVRARQSDFVAMVERLAASKDRVTLLSPPPPLGRHIEEIIYERDRVAGVIPNMDLPIPEVSDAFDVEALWPDGDWPANVELVKAREVVCDTGQCLLIREGEALYFDDSHLSLLAARELADRILGDKAQ